MALALALARFLCLHVYLFIRCFACAVSPEAFMICPHRHPADGVRWPALASHLAARYRQAAAERQPGAAPQLPEDAAQLLHPGDRRRLSLEHMAAELLG